MPLPLRYRLTQDPSSPSHCLHCVDVLRYHISTIWCSSFCVDTHINYLDCLEHLSGLYHTVHCASVCLLWLMGSSTWIVCDLFLCTACNVSKHKVMPTKRDQLASGGQDLGWGSQCLESGSVACQSLPFSAAWIATASEDVPFNLSLACQSCSWLCMS